MNLTDRAFTLPALRQVPFSRMRQWIIGLLATVMVSTPVLSDVITDGTPGSRSYVVPAGVTEIRITAEGASGGTQAGGAGLGGAGAVISGVFPVVPGDTIYYVVGAQPSGGSGFEAGGGGSTGVFINSTLVMVAGGGAGYDNTQSGGAQGGRADEGGGSGPASGGCGLVPGGSAGSGGGGGNRYPTPPATSCGQPNMGGGGGGGINGAGEQANPGPGGGGGGGGGAADLNPLDGLAVAPGGTASTDPNPAGGVFTGAPGGSGFTGGGGADPREGGGGGGYSGGAGANESGQPGGGGSFLSATALAPSRTAGANTTNNGNGSVVIAFSRLTVVKSVVNDSGGTATPASFTLRLASTLGDVTTATAYTSGTVVNIRSGGGTNEYTLSEDAVPGYTQTANTCAPLAHTVAAIGTNYTCTITNNDNALPPIVADDDDFSATPVNGLAGGTAGNAYTGDTLGGTQITAAQVTPTVTSPATPINGGPVPTLVTSGVNEGQVTVPAGTPAGTYTIGYRICQTTVPANCDDAVITVVVAPPAIAADDDDFSATPVNGFTGGTAGNAYTGDTLNGVQITAAQVTPTVTAPASPVPGAPPGAPVPVLATSGTTEGQVTVPAGTPAGTYTIGYRICETLNASNCDDAVITVVVAPPTIAADDDDFSATPVNGLTGGTAGNAYTGDTLNGVQITAAQVSPAVTAPATPVPGAPPGAPVPVLVTSGANEGRVTVPAGTPAGTYTIGYRICETLNPSNCDDAVITVVVSLPAIDAVDNSFPAVSGLTGATTGSVLGNDTLNGSAFAPSAVTLTPGALAPTPTSGSITMNADGTITIAPGTTAGTYSYPYTICEVLNPTNCDTAVATVVVDEPDIDARPETVPPINGAAPPTGTIFNVLTSDLIGGVPATPSNVVITLISVQTEGGAAYPAVTLDPVTGNVTMTAAGPGAVVQITYQICDIANPTNCDTQVETLPINPLVLEALPEAYPPVNGVTGGTLPSIIGSDIVDENPATLVPGNPTSVVIPAPVPGDYTDLATGLPVTFLSLDPATGIITIAPGTPAGTYGIFYEICDPLDLTRCDGITETVVVSAAPIDAVDDGSTTVNGVDGSTIPTVLGNDTLNGAAVDPADITLTPGPAPTPAAGSITMNPDGTITVAPGTTAGTYSYTYEICEVLNPTNCDTAEATIIVDAAAIDAIDDAPTAVSGATGATTPTVLGNDTLNGDPVDPADITLTPGPAPTPAAGSITMNPDGTITVAPGTTAGTYVYEYTICQVLNPSNCDTAEATVIVDEAPIDAVDDAPVAVNGGTGATTPTVLGNDTLDGVLVDPADVVLTPGPAPTPAAGSITMNPDGTITVAPGTTAGTYVYEYTICEVLNPTNCDTAEATVIVDEAPIDAVDDAPVAVNGATGATTPSVLGNDTLDGVPVDPADVVLTPGPAPTPAAGSITMNPDGTITVAPGTTAGTYVYTYEICEVLNPTNCDTAEATVTVDPPPIVAEDDDFTATPIDPLSGGTAGNLFGNDTLNGASFDPADVTVTITDPDGIGGLTISPTGDLIIPPNVAAGTYEIAYEICEVLNPTNCDTAIATIVVGAPGGTGLVDDISAGNIPGTAVTLRVLGNDDDPSNIFDRTTLTIVGTSGPGEPLVVPGEGTWTVDLGSGSITFTPEPGFIGNPTPIQYQVTDIFGNLLAPAAVVVLYEFNANLVCSDVIGKVFDDKNQDGQQDEGEPGIPAVRLATVNGDIITTDEYGRYSIPCAAVPEDIGSTFLLKLDPRSLPTGYRLTTENPKTVRLTQGTMRRMNFGATISNLVRVDLTDAAFGAKGGISKALDDGLKALVASVANKPSTIRLSYYLDGGSLETAKQRMDLVEARLRELWRGDGKYQLSLEQTIVKRE